jgi:hypothetical protein
VLDPSFAAAYVGLSDAQYLFEADQGRLSQTVFQRVLGLTNRAIELAPNLSDTSAIMTLFDVKLRQGRADKVFRCSEQMFATRGFVRH